MPNRILKDSICTSESIQAIADWEIEVFWYRLLVQCDDYGRMDARPAILRARCYPLAMDRVSELDITDWLQNLKDVKLIETYTVDGKPYLRVLTWEKHQQVRAKHSKYPPPQASDNNGNHMQSDACYSLRESESESEEEEEKNAALNALQVLGLFNKPMLDQFNDMWPELVGRRDWLGKAITIARDNGANSPAYALKVLANSIHIGKEPGHTSGKGQVKDPAIRKGAPSEFTPEQIAEADRRQAAYEAEVAAELARATRAKR